ncbi:FeoB-associated Cys-rich membrane protein [Proteiniclasticum sp. C24MP]|uniref:FeoB-associated Cys-rich membrane protein n=1 Tax=Proteiniclasticum sp. C24MP TaxID=3374101 RepID=UPI003755373F
MMENLIVLLVIGMILAAAVMKILKDRKNGVKCSGCPQSKVCSQVSCEVDPELLGRSDISLLKK